MNKIKLTDICDITTGKLDANAAEENGKYPYFTCAPEPLTINSYAFDDDVILLAGNNASGDFHCQRYKGRFNAYQRTYVITAKQGYYLDYIYYSLLLNLQLFKRISQGSQTKFLTKNIFNDFEISDISYEEQVNSARILANIDNKIDINKKIIFNLESVANILYSFWFIQFDFPDENGKPYKSSGGKMVWNEELKREIPEGWTSQNLFVASDVTYGYPFHTEFFSNEGAHIIRIRDLEENTTSAFTEEIVDKKYTTEESDLLIGMDGNFYLSIWPRTGDYVNQRIVRIRKIEHGLPTFVIMQQIEPFIKARESNVARSTVGHLSDKDMKSIRVLIPNKEVDLQIFETLTKEVNNYKTQNIELSS